jgi:hypothetical protein
MNMENEEDDNEYDFLRILDDEDLFYLSSNQYDPDVIVKINGDYYLYTPEALYMMSLTKVVVND